MEKYRIKLRRDLLFSSLYCALLVIALVLTVIYDLDNIAASFALGFGTGISAVVIYYMIRNRNALKNEEKFKKLYIEDHDERQQHINAQVGSIGINLSILASAAGMILSNFFSQTVFFTLLATTLFLVAVKVILGVYYGKRT